jgi:hypothetical protein
MAFLGARRTTIWRERRRPHVVVSFELRTAAVKELPRLISRESDGGKLR